MADEVNHDLTLTPGGRLHLPAVGEAPAPWLKRAALAFAVSSPAGLFSLAATRPDTPPPPALSFWRDFACRYLTELCRAPETAGNRLDPIAPPSESELATMLLSAPPMQGGEYLNPEIFRALWVELDTWTGREIARSQNGLGGWLKENAPDLAAGGARLFPPCRKQG